MKNGNEDTERGGREEKIVFKELSYVVNGCIFDVHNEVGPGLREECYQKAMERRLAEANLVALAKPATRRELLHHGEVADVFEPDLLVAHRIILELKAQPEPFAPENFTQILSYLKFWDFQLGLLVNFGQSQAVIVRVPYTPVASQVEENYDFIKELITPEPRPTLVQVREGLLAIHDQFGAGYGDTTNRKLVAIELQHRGLTCVAETIVTPTFHGLNLPASPISPLVVQGMILVEVQALQENVSATAIRTMQTHLRVSGCAFGLITIFGKTHFIIRGVRP